jgi:hypothetical protein
LEPQAHKESLAILVLQDLLEQQVPQALSVQLVHRVLQEAQDLQELLDIQFLAEQ